MTIFNGDWYGDLSILECILDTIEFISGTDRRNMQRKANIKKRGKGFESMKYGLTWRSFITKDRNRVKDEKSGKYITKCKVDYPYLDDVLKEFSSIYFSDFKWTQLQLNKSYQCPPHVDGQNVNESILVCCGDYEGGRTCVYNHETKKITKYDAREQYVKFDGSKYLHWTEHFEGNRYAIVFYNDIK